MLHASSRSTRVPHVARLPCQHGAPIREVLARMELPNQPALAGGSLDAAWFRTGSPGSGIDDVGASADRLDRQPCSIF